MKVLKNRIVIQVSIIIIAVSLISCKQENPNKNESKVFIDAMMEFNYPKALSEINKIIEKYPKSFISYSNKVSVLIAMKDIQGAINTCDKMLVINPDSSETLTGKGMLLLLQGNELQADDCLNISSELYKERLVDISKARDKRANTLNLVLTLFLLDKKKEAESIIKENNFCSFPIEPELLEILRTKSKLDICKTLLHL